MPASIMHRIVGGERRTLRRQPSVRLVVPGRDVHTGSVAARLARSSRLAIDNRVPSRFLVVRGDERKLDEVAGYPDVRATRSAFTDDEGHEIVLTDHLLVDFSERFPEEDRRRVLAEVDCTVVEARDDVWIVTVRDPGPDSPLEIANRLWDVEGVRFAEPDALIALDFASLPFPEEPLIATQWHLRNTGVGGGTAGADISAREAWVRSHGSPSVAVVVFDSGVDIDHPDLRGNLGSGWDFDNADSDPTNTADPHGTSCAGLIAAPMNGVGVVGVAPRSTILPLRATGSHLLTEWGDMFDWAAERGDVVSCSWSTSEWDYLTGRIRAAIAAGRQGKGVPMLFCTQNWSATHISYPARVDRTIAVGASTNSDTRASFSNYGTGIDVVAPGEGVGTTDEAGSLGYSTNDYTNFSGTSAATPIAAGVVALMLAANPMLSAEQVRRILRESADQIDTANATYDSTGWNEEYGHGRVDANAALARTGEHDPVALRTGNGHVVCAEGGGGHGLVANRTSIAPWETFQMVSVGTNQVALRAHDGHWVCAEGGGGGAVNANRDDARSWETFTVHHLADGKYAFTTKTGAYLSAAGGGGAGFDASAGQLGSSETFELVRLLPRRPIALRSSGGDFLSAGGGGGGGLGFTRPWIGPWETFEQIDVGDRIALRSARGWYLRAVGGGGSAVRADATHIGSSELFTLLDRGGGRYALTSSDGHVLRADGGGGGALSATATAIHVWETFDLVKVRPTDHVALKTSDGHFVTAVSGGGSDVTAAAAARGYYEAFDLFELGGGKVALRAHSGEFVCAEGGGGRGLVADRDSLGDWETFDLVQLGGDQVALRAHNGQHVCAEGGGGGALHANRDVIGQWETFELVDVAHRAPPAP